MVGFLLRFLAAVVLVFATWNPTGYSYLHWAYGLLPNVNASLALAGITLLIGWVLYLRATLESLGLLGIGLAAAFLGCLVWLLFEQGWLSVDNDVLSYVILVLLAFVLALGMSWSHFWRRMSGQVDVDAVEE
jgi:hypothetical protein